jgi:hypothetical protein
MKKLSGGKALFNRNFDKSLALIKKAADVMQRAL